MQVVIEIPKEVLYDTKQTIEQATDFAKRATALGFYKQYGVSVELCSQIAGITEKKFISEAKRSFYRIAKTRCVECEIQDLLCLTSVSEAVTLCLVIALQKLVKPVVRRDSYGGLFVIIGQIRNGFEWCKTY